MPIEVLKEAVEYKATKQKGKHYIEGPFIAMNRPNRNNREYPEAIVVPEVNRYLKEMVRTNRAIGELGHPKDTELNYERACIKIENLTLNGNDYHGLAKVLTTPHGKIISCLIDDEVQLAVSTRALGSLIKNSKGVDVVQSDFFLATAADVVSDPSAPNAFVRGIMENAEWVHTRGILTEAEVDKFKKSFQKKFNEERALKGWQLFLERFETPKKAATKISLDKFEKFFNQF